MNNGIRDNHSTSIDPGTADHPVQITKDNVSSLVETVQEAFSEVELVCYLHPSRKAVGIVIHHEYGIRINACRECWKNTPDDRRDYLFDDNHKGVAFFEIGDNSTIMNGRDGHPMFQEANTAKDVYISTRYNKKGKES